MADRKKIAAIVTTFFPGSHADLIAGKFATGFPTESSLMEPEVDLVSMYVDQFHPDDMGIELAQDRGITIYPSIRSALTLMPPSSGHWPTAPDWDDGELSVDGVLVIGEHGDYPINEREQRMYPRRSFFEQVYGVFAASGRSVPVFTDKHLSYDWSDAKWIYDRAGELIVPLMAGSSLPLARRTPHLEHSPGAEIDDAVVVGYHNSYPGGLDSYGFHNLEFLQSMVERRSGFETGIAAVQCLEDEGVWRAAEDGLWSLDLAEAAHSRVEYRKSDWMRDCERPKVFLIEYRDGFRAAALLLPEHLFGWGYAARIDGEIVSTGLDQVEDNHQPFSYLGQNIQQMFLTGLPQYPVERTLLVTGALEALIESRYRGCVRIETPHLEVAYRPFETPPISPPF